jgi:hypothetical protein
MELSDRELASLAWLAIAGVVSLIWAPLRRALGGVASAVIRPVLLIPLALFAAYMVGIVALAALTPAWNPDLLKDTLIWFMTAGVVLFFDAANAASEEGWFQRKAIAAVKVTALLEFYLNFHTFSFPAEFAIQAWLLVVILVAAAGAWDKSLAAWKTWAERLQAFTGLAILAYVALWLTGNWQTLDPTQTARELALPIWLTLLALPALFAWAWYLTWDGARGQLRHFSPGGHITWRSRLAVLLGYHLRIRDMHSFANYWARQVAEAPSLRAALRLIRGHRAKRRQDEAEARQAADDLVRYVGAPGTDAVGRQLDRREFAETIAALEWLSTCHMGWYVNPPEGRYKADMLKIFQPGFMRGLPDEHGITLKVRKDGQAWYAWRRTITGWIFAVGANGPPPNQWFYDGSEPPKGYPGSDPAWGSTAFERGANW